MLELLVSGMFCPQCGTLRLPVDHSACPACGHKRVWVIAPGLTVAQVANITTHIDAEEGVELAWCDCHGPDAQYVGDAP